MAEFVYVFASLWFTGFIAWGFFMLVPPKISRLEKARAGFCLAAVALLAVAIDFAASAPYGVLLRDSVGGLSGALIGVATYAMWIGIDNEVAEIRRKGSWKIG